MTKLKIRITPVDTADEPIELEARDVGTAIAIADINVAEGSAEIFEAERRLARLTKQTGDHAPFWRVETD